MEIIIFKLPEIKGKPFFKAIKWILLSLLFIFIGIILIFLFKYDDLIHLIETIKS